MTGCLGTITTAGNAGKLVIVVQLDMTTAFDRVSHRRLITKIKSYGITDHVLSSFTSYLSSRNQVAQVSGFTSHPRQVTVGVIQGNVLDLLLFLLHVNDAFNVVRNGSPFLFADDIEIIYTFQPETLSSVAEITQDIKSINIWANEWTMKFSVA